MSDAHAGFGKSALWSQEAQKQVPPAVKWEHLGKAPCEPDLYADLRDIMAKLAAREDADRTAMVVFIAAYYGWRLES